VAAPDGGRNGDAALEPLLPAAAALFALYALVAAPLLFSDGVDLEQITLSCLLAVALVLLSAIDLREYRLPDVLTLPLAGLGVLATPLLLETSPGWQLASALVGFALMAGIGFVYHWLRGVPGLGLGDAKLLGAAGAWLGAEGLPTVLVWACAAAIIGLLIRGWRTRSLSAKTRVPFGPFLAFGTWLVWLYGPF